MPIRLTSRDLRPSRFVRLEPGRWQAKLLAALIMLVVCRTPVVCGRHDRAESSEPAPAAALDAAKQTLSKTVALEAVIGALGNNGSEAAQQTLQKVITGEMKFGKHAKQAAQLALLQFLLHPSPQADAFLLQVMTVPDQALRTGDQAAYSASALRSDAARAIAKAGSADLRLALAKVYADSATPRPIRDPIEEILKSPNSANFTAQVELSRSSTVPEKLRATFQKLIFEKNASALRQALRLEHSAESPGGGAGTFPGMGAGPPTGGSGAGSFFGGLAKAIGLGGPSAADSGAKPTPPGFPGFPGAPAGAKGGGGFSGSFGGGPKGAAIGGNPAGFPMSGAMAMKGAPLSSPGFAGGNLSAAPPFGGSASGMMLEMMAQALARQPVDAALVARTLWNSEFADSILGLLGEAKKGSTSELTGALASIPTNPARVKLKEYLEKVFIDGPAPFSKVEAIVNIPGVAPVASPAPATTGIARPHFGRHKDDEKPQGGGFGRSAASAPPQTQTRQQLVAFGHDWFDPGSLVVLKTLKNAPYEERPKEKHKVTHAQQPYYSPYGRSAAVEKRAKERAEKAKIAEMKFEWRDAELVFVRQWADRLNAGGEEPAESSAAGGGDSSEGPAGPKGKMAAPSSTTKPERNSFETTSETAASAKPPVANAPTPSVAMPFLLHAGGKITKEFHARWPNDLPAGISATVSDPMTVHYVRLEGPGEFVKVLTHYRSSMTSSPSVKTRSLLREIENGKWIDGIQRDTTGHKTRSVDVILTREPPSEEGGKRSKLESLTVEILFVEISSIDSEPTHPGPKKSHETASAADR